MSNKEKEETPIQTLIIGNARMVVLPEADYKRLLYLVDQETVPALEYANKSIGRNLVKTRLAKKMTQAEVAKKAGIRIETLSRLENGHGNPTVKTVKKILRALGEK